MPLNDNQFEAAARWLLGNGSGSETRNRLDFIWEGLTSAQRDALIARIKSDLNNEFTSQISKIQDQQTEITENI